MCQVGALGRVPVDAGLGQPSSVGGASSMGAHPPLLSSQRGFQTGPPPSPSPSKTLAIPSVGFLRAQGGGRRDGSVASRAPSDARRPLAIHVVPTLHPE